MKPRIYKRSGMDKSVEWACDTQQPINRDIPCIRGFGPSPKIAYFHWLALRQLEEKRKKSDWLTATPKNVNTWF